MGIITYHFREGAPDGRQVLINVPFYTGREAIPDSVGPRSPYFLPRDYPEMISYDTTFFVTNADAASKMSNQGYSYIITLQDMTASNPYRLYWGNNFINMYTDANHYWHVEYHDVGTGDIFSVLPGMGELTDAAFTIPAILPLDHTAIMSVGWRVWAWNLIGDSSYSYFEWSDQVESETYQKIKSFYALVPRVDPYAPGVISGPGGGTGTFIRTTTPIDFPGEPILSATDTGFVTLFCPDTTQLKALADYMWTNPSFDPASWRKLLTDPMDAILGLSIVPVIPDMAGSPSVVTVGNIPTTVSMHRITKQYKTVDCGTLEIPEYWGAYLDYDPYTKLELYLPYCGTHAISADDCMGKTLHLKYVIDLLSGACCAMLKCDDTILYTFIGQCSAAVPVTGRDWTNIINGVMSAASSVGTMVATGGVGALSAVGGLASAALNVIKPHIEKSGNMGGTGGLLAPQIPYIVLTQPKQAAPGDQNKYTGYPSFITRALGDLIGYTEVEIIHLEGIPCTGDELDELYQMLKEGVIL